MKTPIDVRKFLRNEGIDADTRIDKDGGGIYLRNLLLRFANDVRDETLKEIVTETRSKISWVDSSNNLSK